MTKENNLTITHPELCKEWHPTLNGDLKPEDFTAGSIKEIYWLLPYDDPKTGKHFDFVWKVSICNRVKGHGCPYLSNRKIWKGYNDLLTTHPKIAAEWDYEKNYPLTPKQVTAGSGKKVWWLLPYDDPKTGKHFDFSWEAQICTRTKDNEKCPYLSNQKVYSGYNDLLTTHPKIAAEWDYEKNYPLTPKDVMAGSNKKYYWKCKYNHVWKTDIAHRTISLRGCPYCASSKTEKFMYNFLNNNNIEFEAEKIFENNKDMSHYAYDIFMIKNNLLIELDGPQHFEKMKFFEEHHPFQIRIKIDNKKNTYVFENDIPLLRIPYTYFKEELKMEALVLDFIRTRTIPKEIIDFYKQYEFSNYAELAEKYNESLKLKVS